MAKIHYDLHDLRAVCELERRGGFNRAADALAISPSALGRRVAKIEAAIGGLIVERTTRSVTLTPMGRRLLQRVEPLIRALDEHMEDASQVARGLHGQLTVGCISTIAFAIFPAALGRFKKHFPNVRVILQDGVGTKMTAAVMNNELDFAITTSVAGHRDVYAERLRTEAIVLSCAQGHPLASSPTLRWKDIEQQPLLGFKPHTSFRRQIDEALLHTGIQIPTFYEVETVSSLVGYLQTGEFIAAVPASVVGIVPGLVGIPLTEPTVEREVYLARRANSPLSTPARALWDAVHDAVLSDQSEGEPGSD